MVNRHSRCCRDRRTIGYSNCDRIIDRRCYSSSRIIAVSQRPHPGRGAGPVQRSGQGLVVVAGRSIIGERADAGRRVRAGITALVKQRTVVPVICGRNSAVGTAGSVGEGQGRG